MQDSIFAAIAIFIVIMFFAVDGLIRNATLQTKLIQFGILSSIATAILVFGGL